MSILKIVCAVLWLCSVPSIAPAQTYHGWYATDAGWELWWKGERVGVLSGDKWQTDGKDTPVELSRCCCSGKCGPCKCAQGCGCSHCKPPVFFGVDDSKRSAVPRYSHSGDCCDKTRVIDALQIEDESHKRRITIVGDDAFRRVALTAVGAPKWAVVKSYPADHWYVREMGFAPGITVQDADGTVIHRQEDTAGIDVAVKRTDPAYDPSKDPDVRVDGKQESSCSGPFCWKSFGAGAVISVLLAVAVWLMPRLSAYMRKRGMQKQADIVDLVIKILEQRSKK